MESPANDPSFAFLFGEAEEIALGWLGGGLRWDTRDSQRNPYRGTAIGGAVDAAVVQTDGEVGATYLIFADQVFPIWPIFHDGGTKDEENPPTDTLALHFESRLSSGDLPFFARPTLGGSEIQRGYIEGRWRDDAAWTAAAEYRFWLLARGFTVWRHIRIERLGAAVFYEVGGIGEKRLGALPREPDPELRRERPGHRRTRRDLPRRLRLLAGRLQLLGGLRPLVLTSGSALEATP